MSRASAVWIPFIRQCSVASQALTSRLFPALPLFAGVLITAADSFIVLLFFRSSNGRHGMLLFEIVIVCLVSELYPPTYPLSIRY